MSIQGLSLPVSCAQGRLVNERHACKIYAHETHAYEVYPYEIHTREMHAYETPAHEMHTREMYIREIYAHRSVAFSGRYGAAGVETDLSLRLGEIRFLARNALPGTSPPKFGGRLYSSLHQTQ